MQSNQMAGFFLMDFFADFTPYVLFIDMVAMMVGRQGHQTYLLKGTP
jgi:hypothetical protein